MSVSVIIAAYNVEATIEEAIQSLRAQTAPPHEVIVTDDGSADRTYDVVLRLAESWPAIRTIRLDRNRGPSAARNAAMAIATGDWIAILDGDDFFKPQRLEVLEAIGNRKGADFVADNHVLYDDALGREGRNGFLATWKLRELSPRILFENCVPEESEFPYALLQPLIRREFLQSTGITYDENVRYGEDIKFYGELFFHGVHAWLTSEAMYVYRTRFGEYSRKKSRYTRSIPRFDSLADVNDEFMIKYADQIDGPFMRIMKLRSARLRDVHAENLAREHRRAGRFFSFAASLLSNPGALRLLILRSLGKARRLIAGRQDVASGAGRSPPEGPAGE